MIDFLIKSTISLIVFLGFYHLVLEREKMHQFNRFYLLISIFISLAIPFFTFEIIEVIPVVKNIEPIIVNSIPSVLDQNSIQEKVIPIQETTNYLPFIIWGIYGIISFIFLLRFGKNWKKLMIKSKINPVVKYKNANLILVEEKTLPYTFLNSIFINFDDYYNRNIENELFTHELVHVTQKHTLDILFIEFLKVIFWFNPILILYKKAIQLNHEFLADEEIVKTYNNVPFYQNLLLQKGSCNQTIYLASNLNYLVTKKRLIMMTKNTSQKLAVLKKIAVVPILAGLIYFFCIEIIAQEKVINVNSELKNTEITEKDKIRDRYYSNVRVIIRDDSKKVVKIDKMYEELTLEEKRLHLDFIPEAINEKKVTNEFYNKLVSSNDIAVRINETPIKNSELSKYKPTDFKHHTYTRMYRRGDLKGIKSDYHYTLYTNDYFDKHLKNNHLKFGNDTIKIIGVNYKDAKSYVAYETKSNTKNQKIIVIDAGHGGKDHGAKINEELESKIVESLAKKIKALNVNEDFKIILLREDDSFVSLSERVNKINEINPSLVISLHLNASTNIKENGVNAYVSSQNEFYEKSLITANKLIDNISNRNLAKGGVKDANLYIIKNSKCPAVLLEVGYLSNENDKAYITSENGKNEIANKIFEFLKQ
ncbi:N-acetylmuramoyl-L-alanine amidase [Flavobacterium terrigena]|uniref:N-acetylmuramoyl-L-alanine amidase n=1 Tax=Flavobacterium terrigena TaxID=402734 RepID=A0A1H6SPB7_9FLAO|nr:N-acetylmuramoyl-L-alanine amidase [Flavobacterium terrigena]SEI67744.1 N-acetylmuramoyl-L-alanine amidase [Flavobacterium terrigena]